MRLAGLLLGGALFHHLHLNSTDPAAAIAFYTSKFDCEKARFAGVEDGVWAQRSWLLFNRVAQAPPWELVSAIWHFGWGAEDMKATYEKHLAAGTKFFTPLTDISWLARRPDFYYAYVEGPDRALIELNTANHHRFGHLHLFSEDPIAAGEWYARHFGLTPRFVQKEARFREGVPLAPSASLTIDNVNLIIYPIGYSRKVYPDHWKDTPMAPTKGRVVDHVAFSVDNLAAALELLRGAGVKIVQQPAPIPGVKIRSAFVEGPDRILIEIVEGHGQKPAPVAQVTGDECLFCHRNDIGPSWQRNRHSITIRPSGDEFVLGSRDKTRRLRQQGYGRFAMWTGDRWAPDRFGARCAGCHTSGFDPQTGVFAAYSLECYACHGDVDLNHTNDTSRILLSKKRRDDARAVTAICSRCHLPGDQHVEHNVRDADTGVTCLSCHQVHAGSSQKHRRVLRGPICDECHEKKGPMKVVKEFRTRNPMCEY